MKRFLCFVLLMIAPWLAAALEQATALRSVPGPPATVAEMLSQGAAIHSFGTAAATDYKVGLLLPAVINAEGKFGTNYTTAFWALNGRNTTQQILFAWLPQGASGVGLLADRFDLNANTSYTTTDFLGSAGLNKSGVGSVIINAVITGTNTIDTTALIYGGVRISTPQPGTPGGTTSFSEWAVPQDSISGSSSAFTIGVLQDTNNRANAGTVNLSMNPLVMTLTILGGGGPPTQVTYTVAPMSMQYFALPSDLIPSASGYFTLVFNPEAGFIDRWYPFAVSANNPTGDGYFLASVQYSF